MIEIKAPAVVNELNQLPSVFLGGGISNCGDWQRYFVALCVDLPVLLLNPRRDDFDISNPEMSIGQIQWERKHLDRADINVFWFPRETLCPITLFELGAAIHTKEHVLVGCDPGYARAFDLRIQLGLVRPRIQIVHSLVDLAEQLRDRVNTTVFSAGKTGVADQE